MHFRNILVRATNWVGDAVMCLPALQHLRAHFPQARISILAKPWVASLYAREVFCDELIPYQGTLVHRISTATSLRGRGFDCAVLLQNAFEAAAAARLASIPVRIGYNRDARGWLLTQRIPVPTANEIPKHQRFYYLELLKRAGLIENYDLDAPIQLAGASAAAEAGGIRLRELLNSRSAIGVCPGAAYGSAKRWLPERFGAAALEIAHECSCAVLVLGSQAEDAICQQVTAHISKAGVECVNLAGKTKLEEFIELVAACRVILTNDSGAMHIGSALGIPTVTVFGATDSEATGPTGPLAAIVREPVECSPCLLRECPIDHRCMTRVGAGRVAQAALKIMHG